VLQGLPPTVRRACLGAVGGQSGQGIEYQVGPRVGHAAEQHQTELSPGQIVHRASLSLAVSVSTRNPRVFAQSDAMGLSRSDNSPTVSLSGRVVPSPTG
jgi:hypothetical protein